jgi:bifunctional DNA-binding transcriptional regulator/antitoxin component of YhaV-PrlF toxin-antitoxin module
LNGVLVWSFNGVWTGIAEKSLRKKGHRFKATVINSGRITIPSHLRHLLDLKKGTLLNVVISLASENDYINTHTEPPKDALRLDEISCQEHHIETDGLNVK